jgi:hypothetical protein
MDIAIMVALGLHTLMLTVNTDGLLAMVFFKFPALYSAILLAMMLAERYA